MTKHEANSAATACYQMADGARRRGDEKEAAMWRYKGHEYAAQAQRNLRKLVGPSHPAFDANGNFG